MRVAVIGSGASGLVTLKECLDYEFQPVCFERSDDIGGLWRYTANPIEGQASIINSTVINSSREMMAFSDFPPDQNMPFYMGHSLVLQYLRSYANEFNLRQYIKFNTDVVEVSKAEDYLQSGKWVVTTNNRINGMQQRETYDAVFVCSGHHVTPYVPEFKGVDQYQGRVIHSREYKEPLGFEGKMVLVVGMGNTGGDIGVELSRVAEQVYIVSRSGNWVTCRLGREGYPFDLLAARGANLILKVCPPLFNYIMETICDQRFDHDIYNLKPKHRWSQQHIFINDDIHTRIATGKVKIIRAGIKCFTEQAIEFTDATVLENIYVIILATGYSIQFPFLDQKILSVKNNQVNLYKHMYPVHLPYSTLTCIGLIQPLGPIFPIAEMQARVACSVLMGHVKLPSHKDMLTEVETKQTEIRKNFVKSRRHTIQVSYGFYMDELAESLGVKPQIWKWVFKDPEVAYKVALGPVLGSNFRFDGIHAKPKIAREMSCSLFERSLCPIIRNPKAIKKYLMPSKWEWFALWYVGTAGCTLLILWLLREILGAIIKHVL